MRKISRTSICRNFRMTQPFFSYFLILPLSLFSIFFLSISYFIFPCFFSFFLFFLHPLPTLISLLPLAHFNSPKMLPRSLCSFGRIDPMLLLPFSYSLYVSYSLIFIFYSLLLAALFWCSFRIFFYFLLFFKL